MSFESIIIYCRGPSIYYVCKRKGEGDNLKGIPCSKKDFNGRGSNKYRFKRLYLWATLCMQNIDKLFRPRISAFYRNMEIWKLMETNKVNIDAKLYRQKNLDCIVVLHL